MSRENRRAVSISNPLNFRLEILVGNHRKLGLEVLAVSGAAEVVAPEILSLGVAAQNLGQNPLLDCGGVSSRLFDKVQGLCVFLAGRWP